MRVQRIALVSPYALSVFGGVQEQILAMSRTLSERGRDVLILAPDSRDAVHYDTPATVLRYGLRWSLPANGSKAPLSLSPVASERARRALANFRPHAVHFHEPFAPLLGWSILERHAYPALGTFHRAGNGPALRYTRGILRHLAKKLDAAVSVSEAAASTLRGACGLESDVLYNGFETERFVEKPRQCSGPVRVFFVGRLEERKGVNLAIEAVLQHNARGAEPWHLVIAGEGAQRTRLQALARGDERVVFLGAVSDEVKRDWLRRVNVLVAPSTHGESFGLVILEAMASETLVVASDIEGYHEAAGGYAHLFQPGNVSSLEVALARALAEESAARVASARRHAQRWSMDSLVDAYEERYDTATSRFLSTK